MQRMAGIQGQAVLPDCVRASTPRSTGSGRVEGLRLELERSILEATQGLPPGLDLACYLASGKRLRGHLALLPAEALGIADTERSVRFAAFVELIHAATLCHDDVVDRCTRRRGQLTINAKAGSAAAAFVGLTLMWRAYALVAEEPSGIRTEVANAARWVACGQKDEMTDLWLEVPVERYLRRQEDKTSALFMLAAWLGAEAADVEPPSREALVRFARHAGLAYQIADDLSDVTGAGAPGRPAGTDLREGVLTLPVLLALSDRATRKQVREQLCRIQTYGDESAVERCRELLSGSGVMEWSSKLVRDIRQNAMATIASIRPLSLREAAAAWAQRLGGAAATSWS
jgi:heptaprenyl diphosphate synthase